MSNKFIYGLLDNTIAQDTLTTNNSGLSLFSNINSTMKQSNKSKIAYLEKDYLLLDGSFTFGDTQLSYNVGYESFALADDECLMNEYVMYIFANTHSSYGVNIYFNPENLIKDFTISYYRDDTLLHNIIVTDNASLTYTDYTEILDWNKVRIDIFKTSKPQQRARFDYIIFGVSDTYDDDLLLELSATRTIDLSASNVDSGECNLKFFNEGRFSISSLKDMPIGIQKEININVYFDDVLFGKYTTDQTSVEEDGKIISLSAYDKLYQLNSTYYDKAIIDTSGTKTLYDWAMEVANDCNVDIVIDERYRNIISKGYISYVPHREAFRLIAEAGNGIVYVDNNGIIHLTFAEFNKIDAISNDNIVENSLTISEKEKIEGIEVNGYLFSLGLELTGLAETGDILLTGEEQEVVIEYASQPSQITGVSYKTDSSMQIINQALYSDRAVFTIKGNKGDLGWITLTGYPYNMSKYTSKQGSSTTNVKKIENNYLITEQDMTDAVCRHQYNYSVNIYNYNAEIIDNIDLLDETKIQDDKVAIVKISRSVSATDINNDIVGVTYNE